MSGLAFRLLFDPRGLVGLLTGGHVTFLAPGPIWLVLVSAFTRQWAGLAVIVFRAGIISLPEGLMRMSRSFGARGPRRFTSVVLPTLLPVGALVLMIVLVAGARVFELILIAAPGSVQAAVDVVPLRWWRPGTELGTGGSAALAVMPFAVVAVAALAVLWGLNREWPTPGGRSEGPRPSGIGKIAGVVVITLWAIPLATLIITSFRTPRAAAAGGWWHGGFGLGSYRQAFRSGELAHALLNTGARSLIAALLVVVIAVPAAYALAWGGLSRWVTRLLIAISTVLAVVPPQTVIVGLGDVFDRLHLLGSGTALTLVHAAFGVPLAVLLLRAAFASAPYRIVRDHQIDPEPGSAMFAVVTWCTPAVITVAVLEFVLVWNDVIIGLLLGGPETGQVTLVLLEQSRQFTTSTGALAAGAVIATLVPLALVIASGNWLVRGLSAGVRR